MNPKASFVIPAHNADPWMAETIRSCLAQRLKRIEIIIVNDGSTDGTKEIIEFFAAGDKRIRPIHLSENAGRSEARNIGNRAAESDIIMVLDSDDKAHPDRAKITVDIFNRFKPDLLYGGFITMDSFGNMMKRFECQDFDPVRSRTHGTHYICHSTVAYRKGLTLNVQYAGGDISKLGIDDWKFIWDAHLKGYKFVNVNKPLCYYRMLNTSVSRTRNESEVQKLKETILATL